MRRGLLLVAAMCLSVVCAFAQDDGTRRAPHSLLVPYDDERAITKLAYRDSPYYLELEEWQEKQTDSSTLYTCQLDADKEWKAFHVLLNVRGGRACRVLVNGKTAGYADDSRHWNEFELDKYLKYGKRNSLTVETMKQSRGALLESERLATGLNGTPYLLFRGNPYVADLQLTADYEAASLTGSLSIDASVFNATKKGRYYLEVEILDPHGHSLDRMGRWVVFDKESDVTVDMSRSWNGVEPWTAEAPVLYTAVLRLRNEKMEEEEVLGERFGFRRLEVSDGLLTLNGKPLTLRGVIYPYEAVDSDEGRDLLRARLLQLKRNNINAVRTALSPMAPVFYELCDELGLYVVCDANLLPVSSQRQAVATDKEFVPLFERRVENLYGTCKNHVSIIAWSLGDTPDNGVCMGAAFKRLKELEKSRPVLFAGADFSDNTDIVAFLNPDGQQLQHAVVKAAGRPMVALAAPLQDYDKLWGRVEGLRPMQGAFVEWPEERYLPDLKNLYSPFDVQFIKQTPDDVEFLVTNRNDFSDFSKYILEYTIYTNQRSNITAGDLQMAIRGGGAESVKLQVPPVSLQPGEEMFIRFDLERRKAKLEERHLGTRVFPLEYKSRPRQPLVNDLRLTVDSCDVDHTRGLEIVNPDLYQPMTWFKTTTAQIKGYTYSGLALFDYSPTLFFVGHKDWTSSVVAVMHSVPDSNTVCVDAMLQYAAAGRPMCDVRVTYTFFGSGDVVADYTLSPTDAFRGTLEPQLRVNLPQWHGDTLWWFGLDREVLFSQRGTGIPGTYGVPRESLSGTSRQQVRWCADQQGLDGLYVSLIGEPFTMALDSNRLTLAPSAGSTAFRLHLRGYIPEVVTNLFVDSLYVSDTLRQRPEDFYGTAMPVVKTGIVDPPLIEASAHRFSQPLTVTLTSPDVQTHASAKPAPKKGKKNTQTIKQSDNQAIIRYTLDGSEPTEASPIYTEPLTLTTTTVVKARVFTPGKPPSFTATRKFNYDYIVSTTFSRKPNTPFNVGADTLLFDGEKGYVEDLQEGWLGFSGDGVVTTVALSKPIDVDYVTLRYAHAPANWAFAPRQVTLLLSSDGEHYGDTLQATIPFDPTAEEEKAARVVELRVPVGKPGIVSLKIDARAIEAVPAWHRAKGLNPWLLMDEIEVGERIGN